MASIWPAPIPAVDDFREAVEASRARIEDHFRLDGTVEDLVICGAKPAELNDFAFVGRLPQRKTQDNFYRCSYCETDRKFGSGRIVLARCDGRLRLIGDDCHSKHMDGARYDAEVEDLRQYRLRRAFSEISGRLDPALAETAREIRDLLSRHSSLLEWLSAPAVRPNAIPVLRRHLVASTEVGGVLTVDRLVEDGAFQQALRRDDGNNDREPKRRRWERQPVHRLSAPGALFVAVPATEHTKAALHCIYEVRRLIAETNWDELPNRTAAQRIGEVRKAVEAAVRMLGVVEGIVTDRRAFFAPANIAGLLRWARDGDTPLAYEDCEVEALGEGFLVREGDTSTTVSPTDNLFLVALPDHRRLSDLSGRL